MGWTTFKLSECQSCLKGSIDLWGLAHLRREINKSFAIWNLQAVPSRKKAKRKAKEIKEHEAVGLCQLMSHEDIIWLYPSCEKLSIIYSFVYLTYL